MGQEFETSDLPVFKVKTIGTTGIERIELFRFKDVIYTHWTEPQALEDGEQIKIIWSGRSSNWNGSLTLTDGRIHAAGPIGFDFRDRESVTQVDTQEVQWKSQTSGDSDGVILDVTTTADSIIDFKTPEIKLSVPVNSLTNTPEIFSCGDDLCEVAFYTYPKGERPTEASFEYRDVSIAGGLNPYYVIVYQEDGEMAISSPIYITKLP
jgi:hypothetical protein